MSSLDRSQIVGVALSLVLLIAILATGVGIALGFHNERVAEQRDHDERICALHDELSLEYVRCMNALDE